MRKAIAPLLVAAALLGSAFAGAQAPDAAKVRQAAEQFDLGVTALKANDFENAASRFEAADSAVPTAKSLRLAIKARSEAKQGSRAATLAALALARYPNDKDTTQLANDVLSKWSASLGKISVSCASPCVLAAGTRSVHGDATTRWTIYLDPGTVTLGASFFGTVSAKPQTIDVKAGRSLDVRFEPDEGGAPAPSAPPPKPTATEGGPPPPPPSSTGEAPPPQKKGGGLPVWVFAIGAVATAGLGGVLVWSGVDALENPGPDAVRAGCAGQGTDCPLYQQGLDAQLRTNVLVGVTSGVGALTVLALIFTDFGGKKEPPKAAVVSPWAAPLGDPLAPSGAALGVRGSF